MRRAVRPYAEALLGVASSLDESVATRDQLRGFVAALDEVPELAKMAVNPAVPMEVKERVVDEIADRLEAGRLARRFLRLLLSRYKLARLAEIEEGITELLNRRLGIVVAKVASAQPLADPQKRALVELLEDKLGEEIEMNTVVDPALLAGFVLRLGSRRYDASLKGQLARLTEELAQA